MIVKGKHKIITLFVSVAIIFSLGMALHLVENGYLNSLFQKIGVYPVAETYTALFFLDAELLSSDSGAVNEIENFTFGIHNNEGIDQDYAFSVELYTKDKNILLENGSLRVKSGETAYKQISFSPKDYKDQGIVYVTLPLSNKSIDFKIN